MCVQKIVFIRIDQNMLTMQQKWIKEKTKKICLKIEFNVEPQSLTYQQIQNDLFEKLNSNRLDFQPETFNNLKSERDRWDFINETRNSKRLKSEMFSLKNSFGDTVTEAKRIPNLLNYRFKIPRVHRTGQTIYEHYYNIRISRKKYKTKLKASVFSPKAYLDAKNI